jgi:hypothetical protein
MTDLDPLAKMLHDAYRNVYEPALWKDASETHKDRWRRVARVVDTMAVPNAPPPPADLELRKWAIELALKHADSEGVCDEYWADIRKETDILIALALGQQVKP